VLIIVFSCACYKLIHFCLTKFLSINIIKAIIFIFSFFYFYKQKGISSFKSFNYFSGFKSLTEFLFFFMDRDVLIKILFKWIHLYLYISQILTMNNLYSLSSFFDENSKFHIRYAVNIKRKKNHSLTFDSYKDHLIFLLKEKNLDYSLSYLWFFFFYLTFELIFYFRSFGLDLAISRFFYFFSFGGGTRYLINFLRLYSVFVFFFYVFIFLLFFLFYFIELIGGFIEIFFKKCIYFLSVCKEWFLIFIKNIYNYFFFHLINYAYIKDVSWVQNNNKFNNYFTKNIIYSRFDFFKIYKNSECFQNDLSFFNIYSYIFKRYWLILSFLSFLSFFFFLIIYYSLNDLYILFCHMTNIINDCSFFVNILFEDHCCIYIGYMYIDKIQTRYFWEGLPIFYDMNIYFFYLPLDTISTICSIFMYMIPSNFFLFFLEKEQVLVEMQFNLAISILSFEGLYIFIDIFIEYVRALNSEVFSIMFKQVFEDLFYALNFLVSIINGWIFFPLFEVLKFLFLCWVDGSYILYVQPLIYIFGPKWFEDIVVFFCAGDSINFFHRLYEFLILKIFLIQKLSIYIFFISLFFHLFLFIFSFLDDYFYNSIYKIYFYICFLHVFLYYWFYSSVNYVIYLNDLIYILSNFL